MNKTLRYSLWGLIVLFATGLQAQNLFNFDEDYATLFPTLKGVSNQEGSHDGDFTETTTSTPVNGITVTISAKTSGSNENRIWSTTPRLRMYSGTLTITAPEGKNITGLTFTGHATNFNLSTTTGTLDSKNKKWTGSANSVEFSVAKNTQIGTITVLLDGEEGVHIANTPETAYTVAKANELIEAGMALDEKVYIKGIVSEIKEISTSYGNATYYISDNGTTENQLMVFRGYSLDGEKFTSEDEIKVGETLIIYGNLVNYNGTYEVTGSSIHSKQNGTGINTVKTAASEADGAIYNLAGQRLEKAQKGIVIRNGKKVIVK